jgi:hypothetical protein
MKTTKHLSQQDIEKICLTHLGLVATPNKVDAPSASWKVSANTDSFDRPSGGFTVGLDITYHEQEEK